MLRISKNLATEIMFTLFDFKKSEKAQRLYKELNYMLMIEDLKQIKNKAYEDYKKTGNENSKKKYLIIKQEIEKEIKKHEHSNNMWTDRDN